MSEEKCSHVDAIVVNDLSLFLLFVITTRFLPESSLTFRLIETSK